MPFVKKECRADGHVPCSVGDYCYLEYKKLIDELRADRRWTTIHNITKKFFDLKDDQETARFLAWMVFFCKEAMAYETEKIQENGDI